MSFWKKLFAKDNVTDTQKNETLNTVHDIPKNVFIETNDQPDKKAGEEKNKQVQQDNIHSLYAFLGKDFQQQGYEDALINPDTSYMNQNVEAILSDLEMVIRKVKTFYEDALLEIEFLIQSRTRSGMVDIVDEMKMKKDKALSHMEKVKELEAEADKGLGVSQRLVISYKRGFSNGMSAIAHHEAGKFEY